MYLKAEGARDQVVLGKGQRWKIDVGSQQDGHLLLSAITISGSGSARERRWTEEHADLEMRSYFAEDDVVGMRRDFYRPQSSPAPVPFIAGAPRFRRGS